MISTIAAVAGGGAIGAVARHGVNVLSFKMLGDGFPWGTFTVNVLGSFVMGVLIAYFAHVWQPSHELRSFLITGMLGAFTTFSAFSLDFASMWERGAMLPAAGYAGASVVFSIVALFIGMFLVRSFVT